MREELHVSSEAPFVVMSHKGEKTPVSRRVWVETLLPEKLSAPGLDPAIAYELLAMTVEGGLGKEAMGLVRRFVGQDGGSARATVLLASAQISAGLPAEAEKTLSAVKAAHPEVDVTRARIASMRGDEAAAVKALRAALELDPNHEHAFRWWVALLSARPERLQTNLEELLRRPGGKAPSAPFAWRALTWLTLRAMDGGDLDQLDATLERLLGLDPRPRELFDVLTFELAARGAQGLIAERLAPAFDLRRDGANAGLRIFEALLAADRLDDAQSLLSELEGVDAEALVAPLADAGRRLAEAVLEGEDPSKLRLNPVAVGAPLWAQNLEVPALGQPKKGPLLAVVAFAVVSAEEGDPLDPALSELSRGLPLYLAEQLSVRAKAEAYAIFPVAERRGLVVPNARVDVAALLGAGKATVPAKLVLSGTILRRRGDEVVVEVELFDPAKKRVVATLAEPLKEGAGAGPLARALLEQLEKLGVVRSAPAATFPELADQAHPAYLVGLSSLLVQHLAATGALDPSAMWNETGAFQRYLSIVEAIPEHPSPRLLAASALSAARRRGSKVALAYQDRILGLLRADKLAASALPSLEARLAAR